VLEGESKLLDDLTYARSVLHNVILLSGDEVLRKTRMSSVSTIISI